MCSYSNFYLGIVLLLSYCEEPGLAQNLTIMLKFSKQIVFRLNALKVVSKYFKNQFLFGNNMSFFFFLKVVVFTFENLGFEIDLRHDLK